MTKRVTCHFCGTSSHGCKVVGGLSYSCCGSCFDSTSYSNFRTVEHVLRHLLADLSTPANGRLQTITAARLEYVAAMYQRALSGNT